MNSAKALGSAGLVFLLGFSSGCYAYTPLGTAPRQGSTVSFLITDAGRVGLGPMIGPSATGLEGVVESQNDSAYVLGMRSVSYINGQTNKWSNEKLVVSKQFVTNASERQFSKSRTALVSVAAIGGLIAFVITRGLLGFGSESDKGKTDPGTGQNQ